MIRSLAFLAALGAGAALAFSASAAGPSPRPAVKPQVVVHTDVITLGDLIEDAGAAAGRAVFRAPALGRVGTIQMARIEEAALLAGLPEIDTGGMAQIVVSRAARVIARGEIETALAQALRARFNLDQPELNLAYESEASFVVEAEAKAPLKIVELNYDAKARRVEATLGVADSRAATLKPLRVAGQVLDMAEATIVVEDIARGVALKPSDIRTERRPRAELPNSGLADPGDIVGRVTKTALRAGAVLRDQDLIKPVLVERNAPVTVVYEVPGISLSLRGKALAAGALGDDVTVLNLQSKRVVQATVIGPNKVKVGPAAPGPVAAIAAAASAQ